MKDKTKKRQSSRFKRTISVRILGRFALTYVLYALAVFAIFLLVEVLGRFFIFDSSSWFYNNIVLPVAYNMNTLLLIALLGGGIVIFLFYWVKTLGYLESVADATEVVALSNDESTFISLPSELKDIEDRLNAVHVQSVRNARQAKEAEQRKNDLIVYLAHDLKTPLTSVIGYLSLLHDESEISPELRQKYLSVTLNKAQRLEDLINEFFEITRFNLSSQELERSRVDLARMLEQILFEFKPLMDERELQYTFSADESIELSVDAGKLARVFDNLVRNAVNYSNKGEIIEVALSRRDGDACITFKNKGVEIPPEKLGRIFEQFYRLDTARSSNSGGAGLGLAIAKEIVELHGGAISAESQDGITTFTVTLPADVRKS